MGARPELAFSGVIVAVRIQGAVKPTGPALVTAVVVARRFLTVWLMVGLVLG